VWRLVRPWALSWNDFTVSTHNVHNVRFTSKFRREQPHEWSAKRIRKDRSLIPLICHFIVPQVGALISQQPTKRNTMQYIKNHRPRLSCFPTESLLTSRMVLKGSVEANTRKTSPGDNFGAIAAVAKNSLSITGKPAGVLAAEFHRFDFPNAPPFTVHPCFGRQICVDHLGALRHRSTLNRSPGRVEQSVQSPTIMCTATRWPDHFRDILP